MDWLKDLDPVKVLIWVAPGAFIALFRSFFLKGSFPEIGKDDVGVFILGSVIYRFAALGLVSDNDLAHLSDRGWFWFVSLGLVPALLGFGLGMFEASDATGKFMRWCRIPMPTPTPSVWNTAFRALPTDTFLVVVLKDGTMYYGRWARGLVPSSASSDSGNQDIFIGETGTLDAQGQYVAMAPKRGVYIAASEVRTIEIITGVKR